MHDYPLNLDGINDQFQEQLVNCVNASPKLRVHLNADQNKISVVKILQTKTEFDFANYAVTLPEIKFASSEFNNTLPIAYFSLAKLAGCCGACVSYYSYVDFSYRGGGLGKLLNEIRIEMARQMKFGLLICTDVATNVAQTKILDSVGWTKALDFQNPKTGHTVNLHYIKL
jgi:hypothetical protein